MGEKMKHILLFIFSLLVLQGCNGSGDSPPFRKQSDDIEYEFTCNAETGEIKSGYTVRETRIMWAKMFANGRYTRFERLKNITGNQAFRNWQQKWRGTERVFGKLDTVHIDTLDFIEPFDSLSVTVDSVFFNEDKIRDATFDVCLSEFIDTGFASLLPKSELDNRRDVFDMVPWGNKGRKKLVVLQAYLRRATIDSIRTRKISRVLYKNLPNPTLRQINNTLDLTVDEKQWVANNILSLPEYNLDTRLKEIFRDERFSKQIIRRVIGHLNRSYFE
jgi:hypothetical protein